MSNAAKTLDNYSSFEDFNRDYQDVALIGFKENYKPTYKDFAFRDQQSFESFKKNVESFNEALNKGEIDLTCPERAIPGHYEFDFMTSTGTCNYGTPEGFPAFDGLKLCPEGALINFNGNFSCWFE